MKQFNPNNYKPILKLMYRKAVVSSDLKYLIGKILIQLVAGDWQELFRLSQFKSYIAGGPEYAGEHNLWEDSEANQKLFQENDVYIVLDSLNFDLAMKLNKIPSGFRVFIATPNPTEVKEVA